VDWHDKSHAVDESSRRSDGLGRPRPRRSRGAVSRRVRAGIERSRAYQEVPTKPVKPVGAIALPVTAGVLPGALSRVHHVIDYLGTVLIALAAASLVLLTSLGGTTYAS
jgi:hypothetical protein